ncbi:hypothetical protein GCM10010269_32530 [Streptomyces humidus]|uniref:Calcium-binding protein n=1 Tax=Streptomyces humidus TaxID=52259 RepID=A0A918L3B0_9ACTN|nr:hypothetical protein [Streptomyces humidus]GGR90880.1 hypothetical protein GCM10010269_32530 [Streptomyces humidus]
MRIRALLVATTGAVALSALAVPAAQAAPAGPAVTFSGVQVNGGKNVVVGPTTKVTVPASYTVTKAAGLNANSFVTFPVLYRGTTLNESTPDDHVWIGDEPGTCTASSPTVLKCTATLQFRPKSTEFADLTNAVAGTWKIGAAAINADGLTTKTNAGTIQVQRQAKLTVDAAPEPVKKGKVITVTGALTRANWDTNRYAGYSGQSVKLQFRKKGSSTYSTVKTVKSSATGGLKTTVTASVDGYYRFVFAGTSTTPAVSAAGDFVDVK